MNAAQYEELLSLLQDIASRIERVEMRLGALEKAPRPATTGQDVMTHMAAPLEDAIADDRDLDGPYGNPEIKRDPPRWTGTSFAGARFSDATPDYLESLAGFFEWKARESDKKNELANNGKPRSQYLRKDAARARGWRKRILEGRGQPGAARPAAARPKPATSDESLDLEMPF